MKQHEVRLGTSTLPRNATSESVITVLRSDGIAILPEYLEEESLQKLNQEFHRIIETRAELGFNVTERSEATIVAIVRNRLPAEQFPMISEVFADPLMERIAIEYFTCERLALNHQIYATLHSGTGEAVNVLPFVPHLDKIQTLKFFVYLTDTNVDNGAMSVVPGSHVLNREHRIRCIETDDDFRSVKNLICDAETLPVAGPAGTLLVFDTDVTHKAGHVIPGNTRKTLRGHTRTLAQLSKLQLRKEAEGITI